MCERVGRLRSWITRGSSSDVASGVAIRLGVDVDGTMEMYHSACYLELLDGAISSCITRSSEVCWFGRSGGNSRVFGL